MQYRKAYISVNKNEVRQVDASPLRVSVGKYGRPRKGRTVSINGPSKVVFSPDKPAPWGARLWIEARPEDVEVH